MANQIILKKSSVTGKVPLPTDLDYGELALNYTDGIAYYKDSTNTVQRLNAAAYTHPTSGVTAGTYTKLTVNNLGHVTSGTALSSTDIPLLDMSKITTGNLSTDRLSEPGYVTASTTVTSRPLFDVLRGDRTAFLPASQIIVETSTDAGVTWLDAGLSDSTKRSLFTGARPSLSIPLKNGVKSTDCLLRVTITGMKYTVPVGTAETLRYNYWNSTYVNATERYFAPTSGWIWLNSNSDRIYLKVERATGADSTTWITDREAYMSGWSGGNNISLSGNTFGGGTGQTGNAWNWRFTFRTCSSANTFNDAQLATTYTTTPQAIYHIKLTGQNVWTYSNNLMYHDHLYSWDLDQNMTLPAGLSLPGQATFNGNISIAKILTSTNNSNDDGSNLVVNTTTKDSSLYALDIRRNNATVGGIKLDGSIVHTGLAATDGTNVDQVKTITKAITLSTDWQDVGIGGTDLATGTYVVQLYANDNSAGGFNSNEYYSGTMSWYSGTTFTSAELPSDEIVMHRAGASSDAGLYLRTYRTNNGTLKLQIYSNYANASSSNYVFKFRRLI